MKHLKLNILLIASILLSYPAMSQTMEANMSFETLKHEFGKIKEEAGNVSYKFVFTNMGANPIVINAVNSSCGCTTPSWSKEPIPPGGKGFINAVFNPIGRTGKFHKTINVKSNASNNPVILHIIGDVQPKSLGVTDEYKFVMGPVRLSKKNLHFGDIYNTETKKMEFKIINISDQPVTITFNTKRKVPPHLTLKCEPQTLKPNQKGTIYASYNANLKNDWGYVYDMIYISFNGEFEYSNRINISSVIKEKFTKEFTDNPPVFKSVNGVTFDFGTVKQGEKIEHVFKFKNTGKNDLIIRKTKASCGCTAIAPQDKIVKPGKESSIKAIFNTAGKKGRQRKTVTITMNIPDVKGQPKKSSVILTMNGKVETPNVGQK